jgi:hypothetical protein
VVLFTAFRISKTEKIIPPMDQAYTFAMMAAEDVSNPARKHIVDAAATLERRPLEVNLDPVKSRIFATPIAINKMRELNPACGWTAIEITIASLVKHAYCAQIHFIALKAKEKLLAAGISAGADIGAARAKIKEIPEFISGIIHPIDITSAVIDTAADMIAAVFAQLPAKPHYWSAIEDALPYEDLLESKFWSCQIRMAAATVDMTARPTEKRKRTPEVSATSTGSAAAAAGSSEIDTNFRAYRLVAIGVEPKQTLRTNFDKSPMQPLALQREAGCMRTMRSISIRLPTGLAATIKARLDTYIANEPPVSGGPFFVKKKGGHPTCWRAFYCTTCVPEAAGLSAAGRVRLGLCFGAPVLVRCCFGPSVRTCGALR